MLENLMITINKSEKGIIKYVKDYLTYKEIQFKYLANKLRASFMFEGDNEISKDIIAETILYFYKFKELHRELKKCPLQNMCYYAFIGALLSIDFEEEKAQIKEEIERTGMVVSIDGFYNFCSYSMHDNWKSLAQLSYKLYNQCRCDEDAYELTSFMLGVDGEGEAVIVIDNNASIKLIKNKRIIPIVEMFEKEEFNIIATVLSHRPTNIIVVNPDKIEQSLMKAIHSLGD